MLKRLFKLSCFLLIAGLFSISVSANQSILNQSHQLEKSINQGAAKAQTEISQSSEQGQYYEAQIQSMQAELSALQVYQNHLGALLQSQEQELNSLELQLTQIEQTKQSIVPLMYNMLLALDEHIHADKPIRIAERKKRLAHLHAMMPKADISDAEKYRRILEAYQIELDYGLKLGTYTAPIELATEQASKKLQTEQLYMGRVALIARSLDKKQYWHWSRATAQWQVLPSSTYADLANAFDIANKRVAPELLLLPVSLLNKQEAQ